MAQLCLGLACLLGTAILCFGERQDAGDLREDTQLEGNHFGSCVCQQSCSNQEEQEQQGVGNLIGEGNHYGSCVCQQSCSDQGGNSSFVNQLVSDLNEQVEAKLAQSNGQLQNFADQMEAMLQEIASSFEVKMAATRDRVEKLQQAVDQLTQRTITEDRIEAMFRRMESPVDVKMAASRDDMESLQQAVHQLTQNQVRVTCPADFVYNTQANICFKVYSRRLSRANASSFCQNLEPRARLVVLDTAEKLSVVREHAVDGVSGYKTVWIGGLQEKDDGQWLWETGQEVTGPWGPGQPSNHDNQNCLLLMEAMTWSTWLMNDQECHLERSYVCEY